jgi:crotonobetainyl-CoA:carnitine CoA-transferase CaiB-like acyl-CoA transferase
MYLFSNVLAALYERERRGEGAVIEISLLDALAEWMGQPWYQARYSGAPPARNAARHASIAPYGPFATADGTVIFGLQNEREWRLFCSRVLQRPELADDPRFDSNARRVVAGETLTGLIEAAFAELATATVVDRLDAAGIAYGIERSPGDLSRHPQLVARQRWRLVDSPGGPIEALLPPFSLGGREARMGPVPALGEHTEAVARWLDEAPASSA